MSPDQILAREAVGFLPALIQIAKAIALGKPNIAVRLARNAANARAAELAAEARIKATKRLKK